EEDALRGLRAEVHRGAGVLHGANLRLEHQVELARLGEVAVLMVARELGRRVAAADVGMLRRAVAGLLEVVCTEAAVAGPAFDQRVAESGEVTGRLPGARVLDDRRVERDDV